MTDGSRRLETSTFVIVSLLALGALLRLLFLDSDPLNDVWPGYVIDEGLWTELARELVLFGSPDLDGLSLLQLLVAPAYQAVTAVFFAVLGVGFTSARLVSALSGIALLVGALLFLRKRFSTEGLVVTVLALALQPDLLFLSRIAIPEAGAMLFEFLAFAVLVSNPCCDKRAFGAGLITAMALAMKATAAPIVPILAVTALFSHGVDDERSGLRRLGAYATGLAVAGLVVLVVGTLVSRGWPGLGLASLLATVAGFVGLNTSLYVVLGTLFNSTYAADLHVFLIPVWVIAGVLLAVGKTPSHPARVVYLGSATWIVGWLLLASILDYFPERYVHHVLVPLAINVGAGLTLLQVVGRKEIVTAVGAARGAKRLFAAAWLALPSAVILGPVFLIPARFGGLDTERLSVQLSTILLLVVALTAAQTQRGRPGPVRTALVVIPLTFGPLWFIGVHLGFFSGGFWSIGSSGIAGRLALLAVAAVATALTYRASPRGGYPHRWGYAYFALFAGLWLAEVAPWFLSPTYTMVEASAAVGDLVDDSTLVGAATAGSVFLGNRLRYTEDLDRVPLPEVLVVAMFPERLDAFVGAYRLVYANELHVADCPTCSAYDPTVRVFRRDR